MHHDVHDAAAGLELADGEGELRVQNGEERAVAGGVEAPFQPIFLVGQDAGIAHLAAGSGEGEDCPDRKGFFRDPLFRGELPRVAVVVGAGCRRLGGVKDASAAYGKDQVDLFLPRQFCGFPGQAHLGVCFHAAQLHEGDTGVLQRGDYRVIKSGAFDASGAVVEEDLGKPVGTEDLSYFFLPAPAEKDLGGSMKDEIIHEMTSFILLPVR